MPKVTRKQYLLAVEKFLETQPTKVKKAPLTKEQKAENLRKGRERAQEARIASFVQALGLEIAE